MELSFRADLWQAVHEAYENRAPEEARRLLQSRTPAPDCSLILRCGDEDYVRWLLSNDIITPPSADDVWPELQEIQLQCSALPESARQTCILNGQLPADDEADKN